MNDDERSAPLPPHDRSWRHPSELAQHERRRTFVNAPPLSRAVAFAASLCAVATALVILGISLPMSPRTENTAHLGGRPVGSVRSAVRSDPQRSNHTVYRADDGRVFTPIRIPQGTDTTQFRQFEMGTLLIGLRDSTKDADAQDTATLRDPDNASIPVSLVARDATSTIELYYSPWTTMGVSTLFTPHTATAADVVVGSKVSLLATEPVPATVGLRSAQLTDTAFVPLDVGLAAGTVGHGTPVVNSRQELVGLFTQRNHASGFIVFSDVLFSGALTLVAPR